MIQRWMKSRIRPAALCAIALGSMLIGPPTRAASNAPALKLDDTATWTPHKLATPVTNRTGETVTIQGNGTGTCCGGWQFVYSGIVPGQAYRIRARAGHREVANPWDSMMAMIVWDRWNRTQPSAGQTQWDYLLPKPAGGEALAFENTLIAPAGTSELTVRYTLRWTAKGRTEWTMPQIEPVAAQEKKPVKICVITSPRQEKDRHVKVQPLSQGLGLPQDVAQSVDLWASLVLAACERKPQLIVTPEVVIGGKNAFEGSVEVPGPATRPFEKIAREHGVYLILGMRQREGDKYYNICALVGPSGKVEGIYRKVHLATSEGLSGLTPGDSFPVFNTKIGRIGCLICMDTMIPESSRMLALNGADIICLPIMGDLRADRWTPGPPIFSEDRWRAFMRTRAVDNQVTMVIARNNAQGSCVIDRKGEMLAWNEGEQEILEATVPARDGYLSWDGGDVRPITWMLRRPELYKPFVEPFYLKALEK